jgi:hypothetical protein
MSAENVYGENILGVRNIVAYERKNDRRIKSYKIRSFTFCLFHKYWQCKLTKKDEICGLYGYIRRT